MNADDGAIVPFDEKGGELTELEPILRPPECTIKIQNVIASCQLKVEVDLKQLVFKCRNAEYNPKKVEALIVRLQKTEKNPRATCLIYENGRMMITGADSPDDAKVAGKKVAKLVQQCGYPDVKFANFTVENLVGVCDFKFPIRLEGVAYEYRAYATYEPEMFAGLVWRHDDPKVTMMVFVTGNVVCTGAKSAEDIAAALDFIYPVLLKYVK